MQRDGQAKALAVIRNAGPFGVSALAIGRAVVKGEKRAHQIPTGHKEALGLSLGAALVRRDLATVTSCNRFVLKWHSEHGRGSR